MKLLLLLPLVGALVCAHPMDGPADSSAVKEFASATAVPTNGTWSPTNATTHWNPAPTPKTPPTTVTHMTKAPPTTTTMTPTTLAPIPTNATTLAPTTPVKTTPAPPVFQTCGGTISTTSTNFFVNPSNPNEDLEVVDPCRVKVDITGNNVCQLRLDFESFSLSQPSATTSQCDTDAFRIFETGNDASVPEICGENAGQHLYVDVDASSRGPTLEIDTFNSAATGRFPRLWKIQVTQIQCNSVDRAPEGCRQYYKSNTGTVKSFNFKNPPSTAAEIDSDTGLQLHLDNQNYQVCIMPQPGLCSIRWTPTTESSFVMTGAFIGDGAALGTGNAWEDAYTGADYVLIPCADYVLIPEGSYEAIMSSPFIPAGQSDRYCGGVFPTVTSTAQPFGLRVRTDGTELKPTFDCGNVGFSLDYRMLAEGC